MMSPLKSIFLAHPTSVSETYVEHLGTASLFGIRMIAGGMACLIHGLIPCWFERTGSNQVRYLYDRMVANRVRRISSQPAR